MKVKFTDPVIEKVKYGHIIEAIDGIDGTPELFVVKGIEGGRFIINPNSDYNFGFILNKEAEKAYEKNLNTRVEELENYEQMAHQAFYSENL